MLIVSYSFLGVQEWVTPELQNCRVYSVDHRMLNELCIFMFDISESLLEWRGVVDKTQNKIISKIHFNVSPTSFFLLENCENTQRFRWNVDSCRVYSWLLILAACWPHLIASDTGKIRRNESKTATGNVELELLNKKIRRVANTIGQTETELWISIKNDNISWNFILNKSISRRVSDFLAILNLW